jgi:uncharacterized protein YggU (UPF0235/DUF167 family)
VASRLHGADAGLRLRVRAAPKSARDGVDGIEETPDGPALKVRVRAVAEDGRANKAVALVVAEWLGIPKSRVEVSAGAKSRLKTLVVAGEAAELERRLNERLAALSGR